MNTATLAVVESLVKQAQEGDKHALYRVLEQVKSDVYALCVKFLWNPHDAEDASQDILLKVVTHLHSFRGEAKFTTWVYRVASNHLIGLKKQRMKEQHISFDMMSEDLSNTPEDAHQDENSTPEYQRILDELRVGCTLAMLQCLDRVSRLSYILGEILELDHAEASALLDMPAAAYRKRLSRARNTISEFMQNHCGWANEENNCRCSKRVTTAVKLKRIDPENLIFSDKYQQDPQRGKALEKVAELQQARRAAAIYRAQPVVPINDSFSQWLKTTVNEIAN
ncbi:RNA polymerase sigma factor [Shewanella sp. SG41-4]|uniref:RNA polymerase sigma factor n=1 Tax=Shewanella sp. SG41-4 TaxID=2760976 RepID=UPI00160280C4|nr:RNA polymerase sigma factor [Shewanella sp. SG41-4]MBB1438984.1 RNA polymerase sigma factor [Shewanella sp. SG41-4]